MRARAKPVLKWAGGKSWLVPIIGPAIEAHLDQTGGAYYEPFMGAGALALWLGRPSRGRLRGAYLSDACADSMAVHQSIRARPRRVYARLRMLALAGVDVESYNRVRATHPGQIVVRAARELYLNRLGFNGLHRENRKGQNNVPYGSDGVRKRRETPVTDAEFETMFPAVKRFPAVQAALSGAQMHTGDFAPAIRSAGPGDVVYLDPPYHGGFTAYVARGFTDTDQQRLAVAAKAAWNRGAVVIATNADTPEVREWWAWMPHIEDVNERRAINSDGAGRTRASCLLMTTDPTVA